MAALELLGLQEANLMEGICKKIKTEVKKQVNNSRKQNWNHF